MGSSRATTSFITSASNRNIREGHKDHPFYDRTARFVDRYDNPAFDPERTCLGLETFVPMVERVLARPKKTLYQVESAT